MLHFLIKARVELESGPDSPEPLGSATGISRGASPEPVTTGSVRDLANTGGDVAKENGVGGPLATGAEDRDARPERRQR
jgi:hypothetical protein